MSSIRTTDFTPRCPNRFLSSFCPAPGSLAALICAAAFLSSAGGCVTNTTRSRQIANDLAAEVAVYRGEQNARVERVNKDYRDAFNEQISAFAQLLQTQLQQGRDKDAQHVTDTLILDDKSTAIGALRDTFFITIKNQRQAIIEYDATLASVRKAYLDAYQKAKLQLAKIDKVAANLRILATAETTADQFSTADKIIQTVVDTAIAAKKNADGAGGKKANKTPQVPSGSSNAAVKNTGS